LVMLEGVTMRLSWVAAVVVLCGNLVYYHLFASRLFPQLCHEGEPADVFQILPLRLAAPNIVIGFHPLFHG